MLFHKTEESFQTLYRTHAAAIQRFIQGMVKDRSLAEELTQETFLKSWKALPQFSFKSTLKTWVYTVALNTTRDWIRSHKHTAEGTETFGEPEATEKPETRALQECLGKLAEDYRAILLLHYYDDLSQKEVGHILKIPEGTVKSRLFKAKLELKQLLIQQGFDV
jgi:RNA polymerase sigma-70 factor (ECF subfamily)